MSASNQRVRWTLENQKFLLLHCMKRTKEIDAEGIAAMIENATPKCIIEQIGKLIRERKTLDAQVLAAQAAAIPVVAPVNPPEAKAKTVKSRVAKAGTSKAGLKRKRIKQESSDAEVGLDDQDEKKIGDAAFDYNDEDNDDPMLAYQYPGPTLSKLKPVKKAKIAKGTHAENGTVTASMDKDAEADIDG